MIGSGGFVACGRQWLAGFAVHLNNGLFVQFMSTAYDRVTTICGSINDSNYTILYLID